MDIKEISLKKHEEWKGKLEVTSKAKIESLTDLSIAYSPGVAEPCLRIKENRDDVYKYTMKGNTVLVVSDGTAVLGLGDIGPEAALPVMEGKAILFKELAGVNAIPICLDTKDVDEIVKAVKLIAPAYGGVNLEDISAPRCFEIEDRLKEELDIPVFHDDQHGTAIIALAAVTNALKVVNKSFEDVKVIVNGAGSAGVAITQMLLNGGIKNIIMCDKAGIINKDADWLNYKQKEMAEKTNPYNLKGDLKEAMKGADVFIGVSAPNIVTKEMVSNMNKDSMIFALANPVPEIMPDLAKEAGARIVATGRSDYPNQVNNVLAFPGIFKGVLEARLPKITEEMKLAAANALANLVKEDELSDDYILPIPLDSSIVDAVAKAVIEAGVKEK